MGSELVRSSRLFVVYLGGVTLVVGWDGRVMVEIRVERDIDRGVDKVFSIWYYFLGGRLFIRDFI